MKSANYEILKADADVALTSAYTKGSERFNLHLNNVIDEGGGIYGCMPLLCLSIIAFSLRKGKSLNGQITLLEMMVQSKDRELKGNTNLMYERIRSQSELLDDDQKHRMKAISAYDP